MNHIDTLITRYPALAACRKELDRALDLMLTMYEKGGKLLACGNGGSAADASHIVGELMKGFLLKRPMTAEEKARFENALGEDSIPFAEKLQRGIPAIALDTASALLTAYANDVDADLIYAQQVFAYAREGDLFLGISTSGNSKNVVNAAKTAKAMGLPSIALTGARDSALSALCTCTIRVPETETFKVQELHLPVYHALCAEIEARLFI
ncbi:MAG: SIS domain-containing protein [Clostridia bacterium]|nr:SIS domain-containing protein [Clostridia bacterium]